MAQPKRLEPVGAPRRVPLASPTARWLIAAAVLGSGMAFLDSTVVNVALPAIGRELDAGWRSRRPLRPASCLLAASLFSPWPRSP